MSGCLSWHFALLITLQGPGRAEGEEVTVGSRGPQAWSLAEQQKHHFPKAGQGLKAAVALLTGRGSTEVPATGPSLRARAGALYVWLLSL